MGCGKLLLNHARLACLVTHNTSSQSHSRSYKQTNPKVAAHAEAEACACAILFKLSSTAPPPVRHSSPRHSWTCNPAAGGLARDREGSTRPRPDCAGSGLIRPTSSQTAISYSQTRGAKNLHPVCVSPLANAGCTVFGTIPSQAAVPGARASPEKLVGKTNKLSGGVETGCKFLAPRVDKRRLLRLPRASKKALKPYESVINNAHAPQPRPPRVASHGGTAAEPRPAGLTTRSGPPCRSSPWSARRAS